MLQLRKTSIKKSISSEAVTRLRLGISKYSPDQPRDYHGRFGSGGSSGKVIFEVAPNPDNKNAMDKWNSLSNKEKFSRSKDVAEKFIPQILAEKGIDGAEIKTQFGSYQDDTNASFSLEMPSGISADELVDATKALGYNLSQKSMIAIGKEEFPGSMPVDSISIDSSKEFSLQSSSELYNDLRSIESNGLKAVGGATTVGSTMTILNFPDETTGKQVMSTVELAQAIKDKITEPGWTVNVSQVHSWFATQENDYGKGYESSVPQAGGNLVDRSVQEPPSDFRSLITQAVTKVLGWIGKRYPHVHDFYEEIIKGGPGSGRYPLGSGIPKEGVYWHGSPSGQFKEGAGGIHVGTQEAARQALEARIGIRADGKDWDGTEEYGKTLLAGQKNIESLRRPYHETGYNSSAPQENYYPKDRSEGFPKYGDGSFVSENAKPDLFPVKIIGSMTNTPQTPRTDTQANAMIRRQFNQGKAVNGYFYTNEGEDEGSISAVVPKASHLTRDIFKGGPGSGRYPAGSGQTKTPAFRQWFGNSKVVDTHGNPKVLYHGTKADFSEFSRKFGGGNTGAAEGKDGFYFTDSVPTAETFAGYQEIHVPASAMVDSKTLYDVDAGSNLMPVHLKIENPLYIDRPPGEKTELPDVTKWDAIKDAKKNGNDGVVFRGWKDSMGSSEKPATIYLAFKPTQIKSAIGNSTFSPKNPDITKFLVDRHIRKSLSNIKIKKQKSSVPFHVRMVLKKSSGNEKFALTINKIKAHPVGKVFHALHKKYEPMLANAFLDAAKKIKSQINMKALTHAVENRNSYEVARIVVGDNFKKNLDKEFKSILFEAYHQGGLIGAQQLSTRHVKKGGPGSGRYPAGSGFKWTKDEHENIANAKAHIERLGLPIKVNVVETKDKNGEPVIHVPGSADKNSIDLNASANFWKDPAAHTEAKAKSGWWSTNDPMHFINHEIGHVLYSAPDKFKGNARENYSAGDARFRALGVSRYAYASPDEFVAEVHAGVQAGKTYNSKIMSVFNGLAKPNYPHIAKGGPGSGPHALYNDILSRQRSKEGMVAAVRHLDTGEVHPAQQGEAHTDILNRIEGDARDYDQGFVTRNGNFVSRNTAEHSFQTLARKAMVGSLDLINPSAVDYLAAEIPELILEINQDQAEAVQAILLDGIHGGKDGPQIAREIRDSVGLTEQQAQWVINFRNQLESGEEGPYTPVGDRRLSAIDSAAAQAEMNSEETDPDAVDMLVEKYGFSLLNKRAMDIAVSELHSAMIQGQDDLWHQAKDLGYLDPAITRRHWLGVHDSKEREDHWATEDMNEPDGVGLDEPFDTPVGPVMNPGDSGVDEFDINDRCTVYLTFNDEFGTGGESDQQAEEEGIGE